MPTKTSISLGKAIRTARLAIGLTQREAATYAGLSRRQWIFIEQGITNPRLSTLEAVAYVLHTDLFDLIKSSEL